MVTSPSDLNKSTIVQEMDYQKEAVNMITFKEHMRDIESIVVPEVHPQLTTRRVIVTSWVDGVKLSNCKSEDVLELCDALLNCYLHQLMGTGFLHADPHPGNLLRTTDGKLCILDFGLVSEVCFPAYILGTSGIFVMLFAW
jgi:aarF domain-containing kinase